MKKNERNTYDWLTNEHPEAFKLFRCGDFYEAHLDDAVAVGIALGTPIKKDEEGELTTGFPYHALDAYLPKLIRAGYKIAICDDITGRMKSDE